MKKALLIGALACATGFYACKKDGTTITVTNTVRDTTIINNYITGLVNADTLTAGLKVGYGTNVTGEIPATSTASDAPKLDSFFLKTYQVIKSRYLVIAPSIISGNISGYYVQIAGAKSYFKVDFSTAYNLRKNARKIASKAHRTLVEPTETPDQEKIIVFKLPESINGDTFYVKYAAYDAEGRVSNTATARTIILPNGDDSFTNALEGTWQYTSWNRYEQGQWDYEEFRPDTSYENYDYFSCNNDQLSYTGNPTDLSLISSNGTTSDIITISKYTLNRKQVYYYTNLNLNNSSCSNLVYYTNTDTYDQTGGYSYDKSSGRVTIIYDDNKVSNMDMEYDTYYLTELTSTTMILSKREGDETDNSTETQFYKFLKK